MMGSQNYIYFFTVSGFFIGLAFSIVYAVDPQDMVVYTLQITLFFYVFIHIVIMNFIDVQAYGTDMFDKDEYEMVSEYFVSELEEKENNLDKLLKDLERVNTMEIDLSGIAAKKDSKAIRDMEKIVRDEEENAA